MEDNNKPFLAYLVLALSFILLLGWQTVVSLGINGQLKNNLKSPQRLGAVENAENTQKNLEAFVVGLLELADKDPGAKSIVDKYQIRKGGNQ